MTTTTLCEREQVTMPKQFRTKLGFTPGIVLTFKIYGKTLMVAAQKKKRSPFEEEKRHSERGVLQRFALSPHVTGTVPLSNEDSKTGNHIFIFAKQRGEYAVAGETHT